VFGGAAIPLAYDSRRATRDVDALFKPHGIVHDEALAVAAELGLPRWWLNEQASSYVAPGGAGRDPAPTIPIGLDQFHYWSRPQPPKYQHNISSRRGNDGK